MNITLEWAIFQLFRNAFSEWSPSRFFFTKIYSISIRLPLSYTGMNIFVAFFVLLLLLADSTPPAASSIPLIGRPTGLLSCQGIHTIPQTPPRHERSAVMRAVFPSRPPLLLDCLYDCDCLLSGVLLSPLPQGWTYLWPFSCCSYFSRIRPRRQLLLSHS